MKWNKTKSIAAKQVLPFNEIITERVRLYERLGWLTDVTETDIEAVIKEANVTEQRIIAAGLNPKPHGVYRIGIIPACFSELHPHNMRKNPRDLLGLDDWDGWGRVDTEYYGECDALSDIPHGFTDADIGKVFFLVEDADAPGHNPKIPGSLLTNMRWSEERDATWREWKEKFIAAGTIKALNYATLGLIWLGDITDWYDTPLGRVGYYDFIEQPYDSQRDLCPFGHVDYGEAWWGAHDSDYAYWDCAAAPVVW